jgi:hypothetical protein
MQAALAIHIRGSRAWVTSATNIPIEIASGEDVQRMMWELWVGYVISNPAS